MPPKKKAASDKAAASDKEASSDKAPASDKKKVASQKGRASDKAAASDKETVSEKSASVKRGRHEGVASARRKQTPREPEDVEPTPPRRKCDDPRFHEATLVESESELHEGAASKGSMEKRCEPEDVEPTASKKCDDEATHAESGDDVPAAQRSPSERRYKEAAAEIGWARAASAQDAQSSSPDVPEDKKPRLCELGEEADEEVLVWATEPMIESLGGDVERWKALPTARARAQAARELKEQWVQRAARRKPAAASAPSEPASSSGGASEKGSEQRRLCLRMNLRRWVERHPDEPLALQSLLRCRAASGASSASSSQPGSATRGARAECGGRRPWSSPTGTCEAARRRAGSS